MFFSSTRGCGSTFCTLCSSLPELSLSTPEPLSMSTSSPPHFLLCLAPAPWLWQADSSPGDCDGILSFGLFLGNRFLLRVAPSQGLQKPVSDQMELLCSLGEPQVCSEARTASLILPWPPGLPFGWCIWLLSHNQCRCAGALCGLLSPSVSLLFLSAL